MTNYFRAQRILCLWCRYSEWHPLFSEQICVACALLRGARQLPVLVNEPEIRVERGYN